MAAGSLGPAAVAAGRVSAPGGGGVPRTFSSTHFPRRTGDVRAGPEVTVRTLACVNTPARPVPARLSRRNSSPATPGMPECRASSSLLNASSAVSRSSTGRSARTASSNTTPIFVRMAARRSA